MNILLINLYSTKDKFNKFKQNCDYNNAFKGKANLIVKFWKDKKGIISIIKKGNIKGIILSGSDFRIKKDNKGIVPKQVFTSNIPILGVCFGFQYLVYYFSSLENIKSFKNYKTYNKLLEIDKPFKIKKTKYLFHHNDYIIKLPKNWKTSIKYKHIIYMGYNKNKKYMGVQFHPECHKKSSNLFYLKWLKSIHRYTSSPRS